MPRKTRGNTSSKIVLAARLLRQEQTVAEKKLWESIRNRRLAGLKFRRQHPFHQFILDAFCVEYQLEVEVDGSIHNDSAQAAYDLERTEFLKAYGIRVLRFTNEEIENRLEEVLRQIIKATAAYLPSPEK